MNHNITRKIIIKILTRRNQFYIPIIIHNCDLKTIMCGKLNGFCKTRENSNFLKKGKTVILVKTRNFFRSRMTKRTSSLESFHKI